MGTLPPPVSSPWIPEDDLILKNAVEGGASLESLARGAVQFSRKFSVQELQERWHSLLYDPVISAEAASLMMEFEQATTLSSKSKDSKCSISVKRRRSESVRNCYYAMRKRVCSEPCDPPVDVSSFYLDNGDEPLLEHCVFDNQEESSQFELQKSSFGGHFLDTLPQKGLHFADIHMVEEFSQPKELLMNNTKLVQESGSKLDACQEGFFSELSNPLFDFTQDEMLLKEADHGEAVIDSSYYDGLSSLLLNSPKDVNLGESENMPALESSQCGKVHSSEGQVPLVSYTLDDPQFPEMTDGVICCMLNTEDHLIPCNDHVVFTNHLVPKSSGRVIIQDTGNPETSAQRHLGNPGQNQAQVHIDLLHPSGSSFELVGSDTTAHKSGGVAYGCSTSNYSGNSRARLNERSTAVAAAKRHLNHDSAGSLFEDPASDLDQAEIESEDEVPNFSDIEAMILDADLDPEDHDIYNSELVLKYQHEDTKKAIMRLDQAAFACRQRAIKSHKAFAVLRGHNSKHYIKKPEVLLGRQTEGVIVDIDLGMEGRGANKISRRQAIIKLDSAGGSFQLKNLGKFPISVNNTEVACGQSSDLTSCCFIEIRGMSFVFEVNQTCVKQYLDNMTEINEIREDIAFR